MSDILRKFRRGATLLGELIRIPMPVSAMISRWESL